MAERAIRREVTASAPVALKLLAGGTTATKRSLRVSIRKRLFGVCDRIIGASSLVSIAPVLDVRTFAWTSLLRDNWQAIRDEAQTVVLAAPSLASGSPDHRAIAALNKWQPYFLWGHGYAVAPNLARCPVTASMVARVPGLSSAFFSILAPGAHIPAQRGPTKGLLTCHLGLIVPRDGDVRMRVGDRVVRWAEGETLLFDDTCEHEVWNDSSAMRAVLSIQLRRPLRQPGKWVADALLSIIRRSSVVQEARVNGARWNAAMKALTR